MRVEQLLSASAYRAGGRPAIVAGGVALSFSELDEKSDRLAATIAGQGPTAGVRVALYLNDLHAAAIGLFAVLKAGAVACPLGPALKPEELAAALAETCATGIITEARLAATAAVALSQVATVTLVVLVGGDRSAAEYGCISFEEATARPAGALAPASGEGEAAVIFDAGRGTPPTLTALGHGEIVAAASARGPLRPQAMPWTREGLMAIVASIAAGATFRFERRVAARMSSGRDVRSAWFQSAGRGGRQCPA